MLTNIPKAQRILLLCNITKELFILVLLDNLGMIVFKPIKIKNAKIAFNLDVFE
jgi:hypothetical protein